MKGFNAEALAESNEAFNDPIFGGLKRRLYHIGVNEYKYNEICGILQTYANNFKIVLTPELLHPIFKDSDNSLKEWIRKNSYPTAGNVIGDKFYKAIYDNLYFLSKNPNILEPKKEPEQISTIAFSKSVDLLGEEPIDTQEEWQEPNLDAIDEIINGLVDETVRKTMIMMRRLLQEMKDDMQMEVDDLVSLIESLTENTRLLFGNVLKTLGFESTDSMQKYLETPPQEGDVFVAQNGSAGSIKTELLNSMLERKIRFQQIFMELVKIVMSHLFG